eukprot:TRINITY_DN6934_c1_g2_i4.p1 TRINITY_DN6934_c1_g2~~TRINITY_DN6934_c1_g2_i4.p1  ORF type:complete len:469 (-),score=82.00 TRINITY_DN6934_c1_g2_i4:183-1589(-)
MVSFSLFVVSVVLVLLSLLLMKKRSSSSSESSPPLMSGCLPLFGHALALNKDPVAFFKNMRQEHDKLCTVSIMGRKIVMITDRELAHQHFVTPDSVLSFLDTLKVLAFNRVQNGKGVPPLDQNVFIPATKRAIGMNLDDLIIRTINASIDALPEEGQFDVVEFSKKIVGDITAMALFGVTFDPIVMQHFFEFEKESMRVIGLSMFLPTWFLEYSGMFRLSDTLRRRFHEDLRPYLEQIKNNDEKKGPFIKEVLAYRDPLTGEKYNDDVLLQAITSFQGAAVSNSAIGVAMTLLHTLERQDVMREVRSQLESNGYDVRGNKLLNALALETARLDAAFLVGLRLVKSHDFVFQDYHIPCGSLISVAPLTLSRDDNVFGDSSRFDPSRFTDPQKQESLRGVRHPVPTWGGGLHLCPGKVFALNEMKFVLAYALKRLDMHIIESGGELNYSSHTGILPPTKSALIAYKKRPN